MPYQLPPEHEELLHEAMRLTREAEELCERMRRAGIDSEAQHRFCQVLKERIAAVLKEFGPGRKPS